MLLDNLLSFCKSEGDGAQFAPMIQYIAQCLYDADVVSEEAILEWYDKVSQSKDEKDQKLLKQVFFFQSLGY